MGLDVARFRGGSVDEELLCPICSGVLESPKQAPVCEHAFCYDCIKEWLLRGRSNCPVDRLEFNIGQLQPVPRILKNLLGRLEIQCDNAAHGCQEVVKMDLLSHHLKDCEFNPKKPVSCSQGCGLTVAKDEMKDHNCVKELRQVVRSQERKISEVQQSLRECQYQLAEQRRDLIILKDRIRAGNGSASGFGSASGLGSASSFRSASGSDFSSYPPVGGIFPSPLLEVIRPPLTDDDGPGSPGVEGNGRGRTLTVRMREAEAVANWSNGLPRAKVTRWGGMISTPDADLQAQIRRCLADSGCPEGQLLDDLMANAHERRWPPGLLTLETRQMNRRQYEQYVCRRVPGRQAVVVMACDNAHMSDDMIIEPGIVMIFAHGIE